MTIDSKININVKRSVGRPKDSLMSEAFDMTCEWLESQAEPMSLSEVEEHMISIVDSDHMCSRKYLKKQLLEKYGDHIEFTSDGYRDIVCLKNMAERIINDSWYAERKENATEDKYRIIEAAAKLIRAEIREMKFSKDVYPDDESIADPEEGLKWIPKSLRMLLEPVIDSKQKQDTLGQCIVYAARHKTAILPVPFGVGVEMDHVFGSEWLTSQLYDLGFSISDDEVKLYKQSVLQAESIEDVIPNSLTAFTQWGGDNADHPTRTIDGKNTFHGMGCIAISTSKTSNMVPPLPPVKRMKRLPVSELTSNKGMPIYQYVAPPDSGLSEFVFEPRETIPQKSVLMPKIHSNTLWQVGWMFSSDERSHPNWSGFMQNIKVDDVVEKSDVFLLPLSDMDPNSLTCIYSTLMSVKKQAEQLKIPTPCITFDLPLWLKSIGIVRMKGMGIVCRLGGFHTLFWEV